MSDDVRLWTLAFDYERRGALIRDSSQSQITVNQRNRAPKINNFGAWGRKQLIPGGPIVLAVNVLRCGTEVCVMSKRVFLVPAFVCLEAGVARAAVDPMVGDWKLNSQKTRLFDEMKVAGAGANKYSFDFGAGQAETIAVDGTDQPGMAGTTLAVTQKSPQEWTVVRKKDGATEINATWTLLSDGNTLQDDYTEFHGDGKTVHLIYRYERRGGGAGFAADWVSTSQQVETPWVVQVRSYQGDGLSIVSSLQGTTKNVKFDGRDYPNPGSQHNVVSSAQRVNERSIALTEKIGTNVVDTEEISVSDDGKTLTMTVHVPRRTEPDVLVFEKD